MGEQLPGPIAYNTESGPMTDNATPERLRELAQIGFDSMEQAERADGSKVTRTKDDAPGWVTAIVREAHGDFMPDDWRYDTIQDAFGAIADHTGGTDLDDLSHEFADGADIYNASLLAWVGSNLARGGYVDEAREEYGEPRDFFHSIQMGQYVERREVFDAVLAGLRTVDTEYDEEEDNTKLMRLGGAFIKKNPPDTGPGGMPAEE